MTDLVEIKEMIKEEYFQTGLTPTEACKKYNVSMNTVRRWYYRDSAKEKSWLKQKQEMELFVAKEVAHKSYTKLREMHDKFLGVGHNLADTMHTGLKEGLYKPSDHAKVLSALTGYYKEMQNSFRLEEGKSTKNVEIKQNPLGQKKEETIIVDPFKLVEDEEN